MSIQAISYVLQYSRTRRWDRLVLISLANHANDRLETWPAVQTIAREAGLHERTVQHALRALERMGEIAPVAGRSRGGRRSTKYVMAGFARLAASVGAPTPQVDPNSTLIGGHSRVEKSEVSHVTVGFAAEKRRQTLRTGVENGGKTGNTPARGHPWGGGNATPPPARGHRYGGGNATAAVGGTPPLNSTPATPGVGGTPPYPSLNLLLPTPTPPQGEGKIPVRFPGGLLMVGKRDAGLLGRMLRRGALVGAHVKDIYDNLRSRGWDCEVVYD